MPSMRTRSQATRAISITSSSSEATKDAGVRSASESDEKPHISHRRTQNPHSQALKKRGNGRYGMFSGHITTLPRALSRSSATNRQTARSKRSSKKRSRAMVGDAVSVREQSPLFEPEDGLDGQHDESDTTSLPMENDHLHADSSDHATAKKRQKHSARVSRHDSSPVLGEPDQNNRHIESNNGTSIIHNDSVYEAIVHIYSTSPLPGNVSVLPEYIEVLKALATVSKQQTEAIRTYDEEDRVLAAKIRGISTDMIGLLKDVSESYAQWIRDDIELMVDFDAIKQAVEARQAETELRHIEVMAALEHDKEIYEVKRVEVRARRQQAEAAQALTVQEEVSELKNRKAALETEGGLALAYNLGRMVGRYRG